MLSQRNGYLFFPNYKAFLNIYIAFIGSLARAGLICTDLPA
jgi:hypothetical protein